MLHGVRPGVAIGDDMARYADDRRVRRHVGDDDRARADRCVLTNRDRADQLRARAHHHVVLQGRVALLAPRARPAQRDALVEVAVIADLRRFADDDAHAVVDEEALADFGARMDLDAGNRPV